MPFRYSRYLAPLLSLAIACGGRATAPDVGSGSTPSGAWPSDAPAVLFATDYAHSTVVAFSENAPGRVVTNEIVGLGIAYDPVRDLLYVPLGGKIGVFEKASTASVSRVPARVIVPAGIAVRPNPGIVFLDRVHDVVYLGSEEELSTPDIGVILGFAHASTAEGQVTPTMVLRPGKLTFFTIDTTRSFLYAADYAGFVQAYQIDPASDRHSFLRSHYCGDANGIAIDETRDRIFVGGANGLCLIDHSSAREGWKQGSAPLPTGGGFVAVDGPHDRLYVGGVGQILVVDGASALGNATVPQASVLLTSGGSSFGGIAFR